MKFPMLQGVREVLENQALAKHCNMVSLQATPPGTISIEGQDTSDKLIEEWGEPIKDFQSILLHDGNHQHVVHISLYLNEATR